MDVKMQETDMNWSSDKEITTIQYPRMLSGSDSTHEFRASISCTGIKNSQNSILMYDSNLLALKVKGGRFDTLSWSANKVNEDEKTEEMNSSYLVVLQCVIVSKNTETIELSGEYKSCFEEGLPLLYKAVDVAASTDQLIESTTPVIPEAFLVGVEDENGDGSDIDIVDAEPLLPWWKQKRVIGAVICIVFVAIITSVLVTLGVSGRGSALEGVSTPTASRPACFSVDISFELFHNSSQSKTNTTWKLSKRDTNYSENEVQLWVQPYSNQTYVSKEDPSSSHSQSALCLPEGDYEFTIIFDSTADGYEEESPYHSGRFNITFYGELFAQGDNTWQHYLETRTRFSVPLR